MTPPEKEHIVKALQFELSKVETKKVRQRMLGQLEKINGVMAAQIGAAVGAAVGSVRQAAVPSGTADSILETQVLAGAASPTSASGGVQHSKALSLAGQPSSPRGRKVAILVAAGAQGDVVGPHLGAVGGVQLTKTFANSSSVLYDAVFVPGGAPSVASLTGQADALMFVAQAYKHGKAVAAIGEGLDLLRAALPEKIGTPGSQASNNQGVVADNDQGVIAEPTGSGAEAALKLVAAIGHRYWGRSVLYPSP